METLVQLRQLLRRSRWLPWGIIALTVATLGGAIALTSWQVRAGIARQIVQRDGEVLHAVVLMEYENDVAQGLAGPVSDVGSQLGLVLKSSQLKGVLGIRLLDPAGRFVEAFPPYVRPADADAETLPELRQLHPVCRFRRAQPEAALFYAENGPAASGSRVIPVLEVNVPLHAPAERELAGIAQFLIEGHSIAAEYARLDRRLAQQAGTVFAAGGGVLVLALTWAFRRLRRTQRLLAERSENLLQANQELALAAKTSALGSVTAHLIHGLKNPLAGLQSYVTSHGGAERDGEVADWQEAVGLTRRMQAMINQVVSVLREEQAGIAYEISVAELLEVVMQRTGTLATQHGVQCNVQCDLAHNLSSRTANLTALILANLVQNAIEVTPPGRTVTLAAGGTEAAVVFSVQDEGPGFPEPQIPFAPCRSGKAGGSGIGLALSKQLANHLGAGLELKSSSARGCCFVLTLPTAAERETSPDEAASVIGTQTQTTWT